MAAAAKQASVRITLQLDASDDRIVADRVQIKQVLVNLVNNAIEAMRGCAKREARITTKSAGEGSIRIDVADTGRGGSEAAKGRPFKPFVEIELKSMGAGLSITQSIVEAHQGKIWSEPNPTGGTTVSFTLPLAIAETSSAR